MAETLPQCPWTQRPDYARLVAALGPEDIRWVGGCVRDALTGHDSHDIDAATRHPPAEVIRRCREAGIRTVPTGIDHGTVTAIFDGGGNVEITTLRRDVATDGRRATIAFSDRWEDDAARRDFTINALFAHPETGEISDYFGGLADLAARRVRFIGDARTRIREDYLRLLRYFRFQSRFGAEWDDEAIAACRELAPGLKGLSRERVGWELLNLLSLPAPIEAIAMMRELGVLAVVLPEAADDAADALAALVAAETAAGALPDPVRRLAALLPPAVAAADSVSARLRLSKSQRDRLCTLARRTPGDGADPRALAYATGLRDAGDRLLLGGLSAAPLDGWTPPTFPLKGGEIVARGVAKGPQVARVLRAVEARWIAEGFPDAARVAQLLDAELAAP